MKKVVKLLLGLALAVGIAQANGMGLIVRKVGPAFLRGGASGSVKNLFGCSVRSGKTFKAVTFRVPTVNALLKATKAGFNNTVKATKKAKDSTKTAFTNAKKQAEKQRLILFGDQFAKVKDVLRVKAGMAKFHNWTTLKVAVKLKLINARKAAQVFGNSVKTGTQKFVSTKVVPFVSNPYTALFTGVGTGSAVTLAVPHCEQPVKDFVAKVAESKFIQSVKHALTTSSGDHDGAIL